MAMLTKTGFSYNRRETIALLIILVFSFVSVMILHLSPMIIIYGGIGYVLLVLLINYPFSALVIDYIFISVLVGLSSSLYSGWSYKAFTLMSFIALFINRIYLQKKILFGSPADVLLMSIYVVLMILSCIVNEVANALDFVVLILMKYTVVVLIINLLDTKKRIIMYLVSIMLLGVLNNIVGIMQVILNLDWYGFGPRAIGFLVNPNGMGFLQALLIPIIFIMLSQTKKRVTRIFLIILFLLCPITAILSQSRGTILATFAVMAGIFLVSIRNFYIFAVILIATILVAVFWQEPYTERLRNTFERKELLEETRGYLYRAAALMVIEHPFLGVGPGKFSEQYVNRYSFRVNSPTRKPQVPHNGYLEVMTATGIPGLIVILWLIGIWIKRFLNGAKNAKKIGDFATSQLCHLMIVSIISYMVVAMFETLTEAKQFYLYMGINIAITNLLAKESAEKSHPSDLPV